MNFLIIIDIMKHKEFDMTATKLEFMGETLEEFYHPIAHIVEQCQWFMDYPDAQRGMMGGFMTAVLNNDFTGAVCSADAENIKHIRTIAIFLYSKGNCVKKKFNSLIK